MEKVKLKKEWLYHQIHGKPSKVYLSLGSNLGDREAHLTRAKERLAKLEANQILKASSIYETEPVHCEGGAFLNQVLFLVTLLPVRPFLEYLQFIETELGRQNKGKGVSREIDLDILFFGEEIIAEPDLQIPHLKLHERRFVLEPLAEINPQLWHPIKKKTIAKLLSELSPLHELKPYQPATL